MDRGGFRTGRWAPGHRAPGGTGAPPRLASPTIRLLTLLLVLAGLHPVRAHHSFASYYFESQMVSVTGELIEFDYRAPHAWVRIKVRDESGAEQIDSAEWSNPNRLARDGVTRDTLRIGDRLIIAGSPGRQPEERRIHLKAVQRVSDGWEWPEHRRR